jgi:hypothetical protein
LVKRIVGIKQAGFGVRKYFYEKGDQHYERAASIWI